MRGCGGGRQEVEEVYGKLQEYWTTVRSTTWDKWGEGVEKEGGGGRGPAASTPDRIAIQAGIVLDAAGFCGLHHHAAGQTATAIGDVLQLPRAQRLLMHSNACKPLC